MRFLLIFLFGFNFLALTAQEWERDSFYTESDIFLHEVDYLSNRYIVTEEMQIKKYKPDGEFWQRYENNRLGQIAYLDVSNPLKLLIFYEQHQTIVSLDNNMSETGKLNLSQAGFNIVRALCISDDNHIWIWDEINRKMVKIDAFGRVILEGIPAFSFDFDSDKPLRMMQRGELIYLFQTNSQIQVFNLFGNWSRTINDIDDLINIISIGELMVYQTSKGIFSRDSKDILNADKEIVKLNQINQNLVYDKNLKRVYRIADDGQLEYIEIIP